MSRRCAVIFAALLLCAGALPLAAAEAAEGAATTAETLLFESDHLAGLPLPASLAYRFSWDGEKPFADRIVLSIDAARHVAVDYLSGERRIDYPVVSDARGNPLLLYFLEQDLREMQRLTGGSTGYFRRFVRRALAAPGLVVEPLTIEIAGRSVQASRLVIQPYRADPLGPSRYPELAGKTYEFIFSSAVPGHIVQLVSRVSTADGQTRTARVERSENAALKS